MVPGTDMRSIPDNAPIPALMDMESVEATGGQASEVGMEGPPGAPPGGPGGGALPPELIEMIMKIGPEMVMEMLGGILSNPDMMAKLEGAGGPPGAPPGPPGMGGPPGAPPAGPGPGGPPPQGALMGM
jgi:hypothetical protein